MIVWVDTEYAQKVKLDENDKADLLHTNNIKQFHNLKVHSVINTKSTIIQSKPLQ